MSHVFLITHIHTSDSDQFVECAIHSRNGDDTFSRLVFMPKYFSQDAQRLGFSQSFRLFWVFIVVVEEYKQTIFV